MAIMSNLYPQNFSYSMHDVLYQDTVRLPSYHLAPAKKGLFVVCMDLQHHIKALHFITFQQHKQDKHYYARGMDR